jgi:hypothetical protein
MSTIDDPKGFYRKYIVTHSDGSPTDPNAVYFVLRLDTEQIARTAAREYARLIQDSNPALASGIMDLLSIVRMRLVMRDLKELGVVIVPVEPKDGGHQ